MKYKFHADALNEMIEAANFYESRRAGYGAKFEDAINSTIQKIVAVPMTWRVIVSDVRTCRVKKFPYSVLYVFNDDTVRIIAVAHDSRNQNYWLDRL